MQINRRKFIKILFTTFVFVILIMMYARYRNLEIEHFFSFSLLCLCVVYCIIRGVHENYMINPFFLFSIVPISLLMYDLSVSTHYLVALRRDTYELAIYNIIMILVGFSLGRKMKFRYSRVWSAGVSMSSKRLSRQALFMTIVGLMPTLYGCIVGMPYLLSINLYEVKGLVNSAPLASIFSLFIYLGVLCALESQDKKTIATCLLMAIFSVVLNFSKTTVVMLSICIVIYFYDIAQENKKARKLFGIIVIGALMLTFASFTIYNNIRFDYDINEYFGNMGYVGNVKQTLFLPLMYIISPWSNLQYIIDTTTSYSNGLWVIKPLLSYLQIDGIWETIFELVPRSQAFNTYTYISVYYRDFGFVGSGICSLLLGLYIMYIYKLKLRFSKSPHVNTVFALNMYATLMMFFNNHFQQLSYPFTIAILAWIWLKFFGNYKTVKSD